MFTRLNTTFVHILFAILYILVLSTHAFAAALDEAKQAFSRGNYSTAIMLLTDKELRTNSEAQFMLGQIYDSGLGVSKNLGTAFDLFIQAANAGHTEAQSRVGLAYEVGRGVGRDYQKALYWYHQSAAEGNSEAQKNLGVMYEKGHGVSVDYAKARHWYQLSAEGGNPKGQRNLARFYLSGNGAADRDKAIMWLRAAAQQNDSKAQLLLAELYSDPSVPSYESTEAYFWFLVASKTFMDQDLKHQSAERADMISSQLSPSQIEIVRGRVDLWMAAHP